MSLEDLLNLEVNIGTYTPSSLQQSPVSVTIINKEDIYLTPARNVMDLIEVYVPGAFVSNHWLGPRLGIRGVMGDQNTSYLLLLNGENINIKTMNGPFYEIQNRDLNDIESIEIIRGPGSVSYGAGAIGGIINIKTISDTKDDISTGIEVNTNYRCGNIFLRGGLSKNHWTFNYYTSFNKSYGINNPEFFYIDRAHGYGYGFMGYQWGNKGKGSPAPNFYGDFWDIPQIKAQISLKHKTNFHFWARYSDITVLKQQQQNLVQGEYENQGIIGKQFISVAEYTPKLLKNLNFEVNLGFLSQSNRDVSYYNRNNASRDDITQLQYSYAQNELFLNSVLNYNFKDIVDLAVGGEFRYLYLSPEWGKDKSKFINSFPPPLRFVVYDSLNSGFYQHYGSDFATQIDETIDGYQYSVFAEANIQESQYLSILLSVRMDQHEYSNAAFSPRFAIISPFHQNHTLKFIAQHAVRLPTFNDLYAFNYNGNKDIDPEVKKGLELIYQFLPKENLVLNASTY